MSSSVSNTISKSNDVSGASDWALPASELRDGYSCPSGFYVQLFPGWYTASNVSSAGEPLQIDTPVSPPPECPVMQFAYYLFQPLSNVAHVPLGYNLTLGDHLSLAGYYSNATLRAFTTTCVDATYPPGTTVPPCSVGPPTQFAPSQYTVAADDEWGQLVLLHFNVAPD